MFLKFFKNIYLFWIISNAILIDGAAKSKKTFMRKPSRYQNNYLNSGSDFGKYSLLLLSFILFLK